MKLSVSILEADSVHLCHLTLLDEIQSNPLRYSVTYHYKDQFMKPLLPL